MTIKSYIDEIKVRLYRAGIQEFTNDSMLATYINRARRDVQSHSIGLREERYGKIYKTTIDNTNAINTLISTVNNTYNDVPVNQYIVPLPNDVLDIKVVTIDYSINGTLRQAEARKVELSELQRVSESAWVRPKIEAPIYARELPYTETNLPAPTNLGGGYVIYVSGLDVSNTQALFDISDNSVVNVKVYYTSALSELELFPTPDDEITIPPELEELVILTALKYIAPYFGADLLYIEALRESNNLASYLQQNYQTMMAKDSHLLPSNEDIS